MKFLMLSVNTSIFEPEIIQLRNRRLSGFYTFQNTPKDYYDQLFGAYWVNKTDSSGHIKPVRKVRKCGCHYMDCEINLRALSKFLGIARADLERTVASLSVRDKAKNRPAKREKNSSFWS